MAAAAPLLLALALAGGGAPAAPFEGVVDARVTEQRGGRVVEGRATVWLAPDGARAELGTGRAPATEGRTVVARRDRPGVVWRLEGGQAIEEPLYGRAGGELQVARLGEAAVAGYPCARVRVRGGGLWLELWLAPALAPADPAWALAAWSGGPWGEVSAALARAGARGWPLRWVRRGGGATVSWEATRVTAAAVDRARLALPAVAGPALLTPEQRQALEDAARERRKRRLPRPDPPPPADPR